jgi:hypothetical protein
MPLEFEWDSGKADRNLKAQPKRDVSEEQAMRPEFDFSKGAPGTHAARYAEGANVVVQAQYRGSDLRIPAARLGCHALGAVRNAPWSTISEANLRFTLRKPTFTKVRPWRRS